MILIVLISFGAVIVALNAAAAVAVIGGTALKRRAGGWPAPGDGQPPVPGDVSPNAAAPRPRPSPAPGPHDDHGGKVKIVELWADGRIRTFDPRTGNVVIRPGFCPACAEGGDWDAALRDLRKGTS